MINNALLDFDILYGIILGMRRLYSFKEDLKKSLKDPQFRKAWEESEPEYLLACKVIEERLNKNMSQRALANKMGTTQAVISRVERMVANPTTEFIQRLARALNTKFSLSFG